MTASTPPASSIRASATVVALLKAVAYGWQQIALTENAAQIRELGVQLYDRLATFTRHLSKLGKALGDSVKTYNQSMGSLERMVLPSARRFTELGIKPREELDPAKSVEQTPRDMSATEIEADAEIEPEAAEHKYYAPNIGVFLEVDLTSGDINRLVGCNVDPKCATLPAP